MNAISKSAMDLRQRIPLQRGNERQIRAPRKSSGVEKEEGNEVVLLWRQTGIIIERGFMDPSRRMCARGIKTL